MKTGTLGRLMNLDFPFPDNQPSLISKISVFLLYAAVYLKDYASFSISNAVAGGVLGLALTLGMMGALTQHQTIPRDLRRTVLLLLLALALVWLITLTLNGYINPSSYYVSVVCAVVLLYSAPRLFLQILLIHYAASTVIQAVEYSTGQYLFIYQSSTGIELNESLFGGSLDVFRAKGFFQGPLSAVAFSLWMAFLFRGSLVMTIMLLLSAFLASGRLGILTSFVLLLYRLRSGKRIELPSSVKIGLMAGTVTLVAGLIMTSDENRLLFMASALDVENDQNVSRVYFWLSSLLHYLNFSPAEMLIGSYGYIKSAEGGTENDLLRILLDCGLAGLLIYLFALGAIFWKARRSKQRERTLILVLIVVLMNLFPFIQSLSSSVLFWLFVFSTYLKTTPTPPSLPLKKRRHRPQDIKASTTIEVAKPI